jgi:hypothetical protein
MNKDKLLCPGGVDYVGTIYIKNLIIFYSSTHNDNAY